MSLFPLCPPQAPPMIGRDRLFKRMVDELIKPTPQSLSLVGPRLFGKSVMLSALAKEPKIAEKYVCVVEWDLGHQIPQSDAEFITAMRKRLSVALAGKNDDISKHLGKEDSGYDELMESFELLETDNQRILMLWDGVDRAIGSGKLTRNLWDNLLALGRKDSLTLVTSSRRKLQELIRDAQSVTSEFWLLFDPISLDAMSDDDVQAFSGKMPGYNFQPGVLKEVINWTGGVPPLTVYLFNRLAAGGNARSIFQAEIKGAAEPDEKLGDLLEMLWNDIPAAAADVYRDLAERGEVPFSNLPKTERATLLRAGLIQNHGGKASATCRIIQQHLLGEKQDSGALGRLFGSPETYAQNIRGILERRVAQIACFDESLFHMVKRAIEDIPTHVDICLGNLSQIEERALDYIWKREADENGKLPSKVISEWTLKANHQEHRLVKEMRESDESGDPRAWVVPADRTKQLGLLQLLTGSHHIYTKPLASQASKDSYALLNAIHSFRNRTVHGDGRDIALGVAVSAVMLCIELLACLEKETH
jgi:hypothetical protein